MKRSISLVLTLCLIVGLFAGMGITASAAEVTQMAIGGIVAPAAGSNVVTTGVTGVPEGFDVTVEWMRYNYSNHTFEAYEKTTFEDDSVYRLGVIFEAKEGYWINEYIDEENFTINGTPADDFFVMAGDENGFTVFGLYNFYYVGDIIVLDQITISQLPAPQAGTSTAVSEIKVPDGSPYYVGGVSWIEATQWESFEGTTLEENGQYILYVDVFPREGYFFHYGTEIAAPTELRSGYFQDAHGYMNCSFNYDLRPHVDKVELTGDFDFAYGDKTADFSFTVPANAAYNVELVQFRCWSDALGWTEDFTGKIDYNEYTLELRLTPKTGVVLVDDIQIMINGAPAEGDWEVYGGGAEKILQYWFVVEPEKGFIEDMTLSGAPAEITAGAEIKLPAIKKESGEASVTKVQWVDKDYAPVTGKFEANKVYYLAITLQAEAGYGIREGYYVEIEKDDGDYDHPYVSRNDDGTVTVYARYSLQPKIDKVELQLPEASIGSALGTPTVPSGAKYKVEDHYWWAQQGNERPTKYEDNNKYYLEAYLTPAEGYEFSEDLVVTINGKEIDTFGHRADDCNVNYSVSFLKKIQKVEFPALPAVKLGDTLEDMDLQAPAGANYTLYAYWGKPEDSFGVNGYQGPAEDKNVYYLICEASPNAGYEFAENVVYTVGGKAYNTGFRVADENGILLTAQYVFGLQVIDKIELTFPQPALGKKPDKIAVPTNAAYVLESSGWEKSEDDKLQSTRGMKKDEVFKAGQYYWVYGTVKAKEGYVFAEDVKVLLNGKEVDMSAFMEQTGMPNVWGSAAMVYTNLGKLVDPTNPNSGDDMQLGLYMVLAVIAAAGLGITATKKKYF